MDKAAELRERVQNEIVNLITTKLEAGQITEERARQIASMVLEKLPEGIGYNELMQVIPTLDDHFQELAETVVPIMVEYEKKMKSIVDVKLKELIKQGRLDDALNVTKKAIEFEKNLT